MRRTYLVVTAAVVGLAVVGAGLWYAWREGALPFVGALTSGFDVNVEPDAVDLAATWPTPLPDALVMTKSLGSLTRDMRSNEFLKNTLTEELLFQYETTESLARIRGILRRISFEHDPTLLDSVLGFVLDTPAEIAFWRDKDGKLGDFLLVSSKLGIGAVTEALAKIGSDAQLRVFGQGRIVDTKPVTIYEIPYGGGRSIYFAVNGDDLFLFTNAALVVPKDDAAVAWDTAVKTAFKREFGHGILSALFGVQAADPSTHVVALSFKFLAFGYHKLFPQLRMLRFDYRGHRWLTGLLVADGRRGIEKTGDLEDLWKGVPHGASLCAALPVDGAALGTIAQQLFQSKKELGDRLTAAIASPVGVCWYGDSSLYSPLFVLATGGRIDEQATGEAFATLFPSTPPTPVQSSPGKGATLRTMHVTSKYIPGKDGYDVTLARSDAFVAFSADGKLAQRAAAVWEKTYPSLSEKLSDDGEDALFVVSPAATSTLVKQAIDEALGDPVESLFKESLTRDLFPALDAAAKFPPYSVDAQGGAATGRTWLSLAWRESK